MASRHILTGSLDASTQTRILAAAGCQRLRIIAQGAGLRRHQILEKKEEQGKIHAAKLGRGYT